MPTSAAGPLAGVLVVELGGIGPTPFCGMLLADLGAEVVRILRPNAGIGNPVLARGRRHVRADLKSPDGLADAWALLARADIALEGFRPGVLERIGLAPAALLAANPPLVLGRMTGYGQDGPYADRAGHDLNYIATAGVLGAIGHPGDAPAIPLNLVGDFGGGGMLLAVGVLAALTEARRTGQGQVVDAAMVDGAALLMAMTHGMAAQGRWTDGRGTNLLDGGAPYYTTYRCADDEYVAVGAIEPQFFATLVQTLGLTEVIDIGRQQDRSTWPAVRAALAAAFADETRMTWAERFADVDACVTPVLSLAEAAADPHNRARGVFVTDAAGVRQPAPAPRFSSPAAAGA